MIVPCRMIARGSGASFSKPGASASGDSMPDNSPASCAGCADLRPQHDPDTHAEWSQSAVRLLGECVLPRAPRCGDESSLIPNDGMRRRNWLP